MEPRTATESWRMQEAGLESENIFYQILIDKFGVETVDPSQVGKELNRAALARATEKQDTEEGIDFFMYITPKESGTTAGVWIPFDFTTAKDSEIIEEKRRKEQERGIKILNIRAYVLKQANLGSTKDLQIVADSVTSAVAQALKAARGKETIGEKAIN